MSSSFSSGGGWGRGPPTAGVWVGEAASRQSPHKGSKHRLGSTLGASPGGGCRDRDSWPGNGVSLSVAPEAAGLTLTTRGAGACSVRPPPWTSPLVTVSKQAEQECALQSSEGKGNPCSPSLPAGRLSERL